MPRRGADDAFRRTNSSTAAMIVGKVPSINQYQRAQRRRVASQRRAEAVARGRVSLPLTHSSGSGSGSNSRSWAAISGGGAGAGAGAGGGGAGGRGSTGRRSLPSSVSTSGRDSRSSPGPEEVLAKFCKMQLESIAKASIDHRQRPGGGLSTYDEVSGGKRRGRRLLPNHAAAQTTMLQSSLRPPATPLQEVRTRAAALRPPPPAWQYKCTSATWGSNVASAGAPGGSSYASQVHGRKDSSITQAQLPQFGPQRQLFLRQTVPSIMQR